MANRFEVQVVALDRFTKTFRDLNDRASKTARPLVNVQRQIGALAREAHLDKVAKGLGHVSEAAVTVGRTLGVSLGPLESILGMGAAGGIIGGVTALGVAAVGLGARFGNAGFEIGRTSQRIGVSAKELQDWRGAGELANVSVEATTAALEKMGTTLQDAKWGRDPAALQALNKLGIGVPMKNGLVDISGALFQISDAMRSIDDPHARQVLADALHLPPEAIPLLLEGADGVRALSAEYRRLHGEVGPKALQWSEDFTKSLNRLKVAADGVAMSVGGKVVPSLTKGMDAVTNRLAQSHSNPLGAWLGLNGDALRGGMKVTGVGALFDKARDLLRGPALTTPDQRTVSGRIGGALQQRAFKPATQSLGTGLQSGGVTRQTGQPDTGIKRNNPGNLRSWPGMPSDGGFARFKSSMDGLEAMGQQLELYAGRGINTPRSIIGTYAPPSENNTDAYLADVVKKTGFGADQKLDLGDRDTLRSMLQAMVGHEQGRQPFTSDQYSQAAKQAIEVHVQVHGLPDGTKVTSHTKADKAAFVPTLISYAMPTGNMP